MKRARAEIAAAVLRLATEQLIHVDTVSKELHVTKESIKRWGTKGRTGVFLDVTERDGQWFTSREALARFQREYAALTRLQASNTTNQER